MKKNKTSKFAALAVFVAICTPNAMAQSTMTLGENENAKDCYQASVSAAQGYGASFQDLQRCDDALRIGQMRSSDVVATHVNRGIIYVALGKLDRAIDDYGRALNMRDDLPEPYLNRGNLWFMSERYENAIKDYDRAMQLDIRQMHVLYLNRGMAYELMGSFDRAKNDYLSALDLVPEWSPAVEKLDRVSKKQAEAAG